MIRISETTLTRFIKDECANFDKHYQSCLFSDLCKVLNGKRCGYFEQCVLGPPDNRHRLPGYDYSKLFAQYAVQTGAKRQTVKVNFCSEATCKRPIPPGRRYCDRCKKERRRKTKREYQQHFRRKQNISA